jgi:hypothetical protein
MMFGVEITRREGKVIAPREEIRIRKKMIVGTLFIVE